MAIILRTVKGSELTFAEVDGNFQSLFYSSSFDGTNLILYTTGSTSQSIDLSTLSVDTGSLMVTGSILNGTLTFTKGDDSTFDLVYNTGSFSGSFEGDGSGLTNLSVTSYWETGSGEFSIKDVNSSSTIETAVSFSVIAGGTNHTITSGNRSGIYGGFSHSIEDGASSVIVGGREGLIAGNSSNSFIGGGQNNALVSGNGVSQYSRRSGIVAGANNTISGSDNAVILGGSGNTLNFQSEQGAIIGGRDNTLNNQDSVIIGGFNNTLAGSYSAIIGGQNIVGGASNTVYVPNLVATGSVTGSSFTGSFVGDGSGLTNLNHTSSLQNVLDVGSTYSGATTVSITSTSGADSVVYTHSPTSFIASKDDGTYQSKFELGATGLVHIQSEEPGSGNPQADLFFNPSSHGSGGIILRFTPDFPANSQEIAMLSTGIRIVENFANAGLYYNADYNTQGIINHGNRWIPDVGYISGSYAKLDGSSITGSFTGSFIGDGSGLTGIPSTDTLQNVLDNGSTGTAIATDIQIERSGANNSQFDVINEYVRLQQSASGVTTEVAVRSGLFARLWTDNGTTYENTISVNASGVHLAYDNYNTSSTDAYKRMDFTSAGMIIEDGQDDKGLEYYDDYSGNFTARSLVDKGYVDTQITASSTGSFTGSFVGDGSGLTGLVSSSYALTSSYVENAQTSSYVENAQTASYVTTAQTASYVETAQTASYVDLVAGDNIIINQVGTSFEISGSVSAVDTSSLLTTASAEFAEITFTKGDGSTFLVDSTPRQVKQTVKNLESGTLVKGTPVYASGSTGNAIHVYAASASLSSRMPAAYILNQDLTSGQEGEGLLLGFINGVDTSAFASGDVVYVAADGGYTNVKPTGSNLIQNLGKVIISDVNGSGVISGAGRANDVPNIQEGYVWVGDSNGVATPSATSSIQNVVSSSYALTSSHAQSGDGIFSGSFSGSFVGDGSGLTGIGSGLDINTTVNSGSTVVYNFSTASLDGGFIDYVLKESNSGSRAGNIMSVWSGASIQYNEVTTLDIGDTANVTFSMDISGGNARLIVDTIYNNWTLKAKVREI